MTTKKPTLKAFAQEHSSGQRGDRSCAICRLEPELREQVDDALRAGERAIIYAWAQEYYPDQRITLGTLDHHRRSRHHLEA